MKTPELGFIFEQELKEKVGTNLKYSFRMRLSIFWILLIAVFIVLVFRLFSLQIIEGERNRVLSDENRILARRIQAPRGAIIDRNGEVLTQNVPVYTVCDEERNQGISTVDIKLESDFFAYCSSFSEILREEALMLEAQGQGGRIRTLVGRKYIYGPEIAHLVGYVGEIDKEELEARPDYNLGDLIGKMGVEKEYEEDLRGRDGAEIVEIDAQALVVREVAKRDPIPGSDLKLTIDARLQKKAYEIIKGREGAVVAVKPRTGEVLTLVSSPSFDPNDVSVSLTREDQPFFNRGIGGLYPPGSVFKVVTAVSGLEEGKINSSTEIEDTGEIRIGSYRYGNWYFDQYGRKEGFLNIVKAIKRSNDIFFYRVGELVGAMRLSEWAKAFGYGQKTGIDLPGEADGLVPSPLWKERIRGERWFLGNTYHLAIGQSDLQTTPLQVTAMTAVVANEGKLCRPSVVTDKSDGDRVDDCQDLEISEKTLDLVKEGMVEACRPRGTAFPFFDFQVEREGGIEKLEVGCKTGTAEFGDPQDRTHAWFTVFGPYEDPEIVVTVLLEKAGEGSYEAAPVAKEFLKYYFEEVEKR